MAHASLSDVFKPSRPIVWIFSNFADFHGIGAKRAFLHSGKGKIWPQASIPVPRKIWQTLGAIKTGVILLILVVIVSAAGTVILQRPATDADEMQRAYSPQVLRLLDGVGLTDVFHAWWFVLLLTPGQPQHCRRLDPALSQCLEILLASL